MKPFPSSEENAQDQEIIKLLKELGSFEAAYPPELQTARRTAFLEQVRHLEMVEADELSAGDQEVVRLLGTLKSAPVEYPAALLTARRSAFLHQMERAGEMSLWDRFRTSLQRGLQPKPGLPRAGAWRTSLVLASLLIAALIGSLFLRREPSFQSSPLQPVTTSTHLLPTRIGDVAISICKPGDQAPTCLVAQLDASQDLADAGNGRARPAVAKDARPSQSGVYQAAFVNDGRGGASWVSNSPDSWIKIDLGEVQTINTVSLQKGDLGPSSENDPGQFVIAVARSDVYADGDSSNDFTEYAQVFHSEQTGFSGTVSSTETIQTHFPPVEARFVKITFEQAGAAIEEIGVFMMDPPVLAEQPTGTPSEEVAGITSTPFSTNTMFVFATQTITPVSTGTRLPTGTVVAVLTHTARPSATFTPLATNTRPPFNTPTLLPTNTLPPANTATPLPTNPWPSDTPVAPTVVLPTEIPPTTIPPTLEPTFVSTDPIVVTGNNQTMTFTCNGNDAEIRGHSNTVTLLGSCSSITVTGNGNQVFWQSGSPVIIDRGKDNIIQQL